ncbi:dephospho-CoA kinase/protein folding accessory domain-containing protein [Clostridium tepidiprofundi DSM 19306]|uniref:Dephospho-CoA kinase/protein folding accessory domain-containing protein n=1 Tax=Clostridium tepidiprofundi DSM 19306 TaxID=1121338 RepID=A0A151B3B3_9CLOT|nr:GrpB family protein [Clostridium tepidiprofundi]KYH34242.1 dephospho-CoA kinase/protein folding accessory domain-containing protein [Clostridium tepidiprofundi DSM 19306]
MKKQLSEMSLEELWMLFPIILEEHNKDYERWYTEEKDKIVKCIGIQNIRRINHIGSSSVKGLIAKPIIDILLEVNEELDLQWLKDLLKSNGWTLMSASDEGKPHMKIFFNKGYTPKGFADKVYHLHVRYLGDWNELYFRDYLIKHNDVADEYGKLKLSLLPKYKNNRDGYTEAKTDFILKYSNLARKEFGDRYLISD